VASESENKLLARRLLDEVVNTGDVDRLSDFLAPHFVVPHTNITSIEGFRDHVLEFHRWYPDLVVTVEGQVAEADIVVTWWTMRGTHLGEFFGVPPTKKQITLRGVNVQKIRDGRIVEHWGGANSLEALLELGVIGWSGGVSAAPTTAQPCATPNGGPATQLGNSSVTEGPPSVS
jgi:steroid delta-isomerase-like uncharacterized protein